MLFAIFSRREDSRYNYLPDLRGWRQHRSCVWTILLFAKGEPALPGLKKEILEQYEAAMQSVQLRSLLVAHSATQYISLFVCLSVCLFVRHTFQIQAVIFSLLAFLILLQFSRIVGLISLDLLVHMPCAGNL